MGLSGDGRVPKGARTARTTRQPVSHDWLDDVRDEARSEQWAGRPSEGRPGAASA
jgi:hypothetical protein